MYFRASSLSSDKLLQAYVIGLAIGDGNLSIVNRTPRLKITCDKKYPGLIEQIAISLRTLFPANKVHLAGRKNCLDVSVFSNHLENLLGWKASAGSKFKQNVDIPNWIKASEEYLKPCLKGLFETDGSVYIDRGYKMAIFVTIIPVLAASVTDAIQRLGFKAHCYKIKPQKNRPNSQTRYNIRISKNTDAFIRTIRIDKH